MKAPESDEEYICGSDDTQSFSLNDLREMNASEKIVERGRNYYFENKVAYICLDGTKGYAIVCGGDNYEVEFNFDNRHISDIKCSCFCGYSCKHEYAAMLQLREVLDRIAESFEDEYNGYFAAISQEALVNTVLNIKIEGKISLDI